ncbi:MAG: PTS sugar transporter subunit IIA [Planctomycetes bacterium]|nr:PTS sugar transporter subunit IIA [Planctomycetota bacterium]
MQFRDFVVNKAIVGDLVSTTKNEAIAEMTDALIASGAVSKDLRQGVLSALIDREKLGSTGIGQGIGIPHAKHPGIKSLIALVARSREGVEFASLDGEPVNIFFMMLSNQECATQHLEALAYVSKHLRDDIFRRFLIKARDAKEIAELLEEADQKSISGG